MEIHIFNKEKVRKANLYRKEFVSSSFPIKVVGFALLIIGLIVFLWFGVLSRYIEINSKKSILLEEKSNLEAIEVRLDGYAEIEEDYLRYSKDYMSAEEREIVDRSAALDIVDRYLLSSCDVSKLQITNNEILTTLKNATMSTASGIINRMNEDGNNLIKYATTKNARNEINSNVPSVEMTVYLTNGKSEVANIE